MFKIFRRVRLKLLGESKVNRYIFYATGEIVLVVIGILIALQINNWNENRKLRSVEIKILQDIKNDLQENSANLSDGVDLLEISNKELTMVLTLFEQKTPYHDSLLPAFATFIGQWDPDFTYAGFENLENLGVNIISNASLRKEIINMFEVEMDILDNSDMSRVDQMNEVMVLPMMKKYFYRDLSKGSEFPPLIPSNYEAMIYDQEFYNVCAEMSYRQRKSISRFLEFNKKAGKLISKIDAEIRELE